MALPTTRRSKTKASTSPFRILGIQDLNRSPRRDQAAEKLSTLQFPALSAKILPMASHTHTLRAKTRPAALKTAQGVLTLAKSRFARGIFAIALLALTVTLAATGIVAWTSGLAITGYVLFGLLAVADYALYGDDGYHINDGSLDEWQDAPGIGDALTYGDGLSE
jgi:hypothetical protein